MTLFSDIMEFDSKAERLAADLARVTKERDLLLEACKADAFAEQYWEEHVNSTNGGNVCDTYKGLVNKARQLRCAAIAAAEKGGE